MKNLKQKNGIYYFKQTRLYVPAEELRKKIALWVSRHAFVGT